MSELRCHGLFPSIVRSPSADFQGFATGLGKLYKQYRRGLPSDVQLLLRDLLRALGRYYAPLEGMSACQNIRVARGDLSD